MIYLVFAENSDGEDPCEGFDADEISMEEEVCDNPESDVVLSDSEMSNSDDDGSGNSSSDYDSPGH